MSGIQIKKSWVFSYGDKDTCSQEETTDEEVQAPRYSHPFSKTYFLFHQLVFEFVFKCGIFSGAAGKWTGGAAGGSP